MSELVPSLCVDDASFAIDWYREVLGAAVVYDAIVLPGGRIAYVELAIGGSRFTLSDQLTGGGVATPRPGRATQVGLHLSVGDVDALAARVVAAGGSIDCGPTDLTPFGRVAVLRDAFGHRWVIDRADD